MKRFSIVFLVSMIFSLPVSASGEWPMYGFDKENSGYCDIQSNLVIENLSLLWDYETDGWVSSPVTVDLNNDSRLEIVFGSDDNNLYAVDSGGELLWKFTTGGAIRSSPLFYDGIIFFGSDDTNLYALNSTGDLLWKFTTGDRVRSSPVASDVNNDSRLEIVFGSDDKNLYIVDINGRKLKEFTTGGAIRGSPAIGDINDDDIDDIIFTSDDNRLYVLIYGPPRRVLNYMVSGDISSPVFYDSRIIFASEDGFIYSLSYTEYEGEPSTKVCDIYGCHKVYTKYMSLSKKWDYDAGNAVISTPAVSDDWVVIGSKNKNLYILDTGDGGLFNRYSISGTLLAQPIIVDLNADGEDEIILGTDDGILYIFNSEFHRVWSYDLDTSIRTSPIVADLDDDGRLEIIVGCIDNKLYVFGSGLTPQVTTTTSTTTSLYATSSSISSSTTSSTTTTVNEENPSTTSIKVRAVISEISSTTTTIENLGVVGRAIGVEISAVNGGIAISILLFSSIVIYIVRRERKEG